MIVVDASVWVSSLLPDDVFHLISRAWLQRQSASGEPLVAPVLMLPEVAGAIARRTHRAALGQSAVASLLRLRGLRLASIDRRVGQEAARLAAVAGLRGADAVYVAIAHQLSIPLVTWDDELQDRAGQWLIVQRPANPEA